MCSSIAGFGHKGLNEFEAKKLFSDKIWRGLESYVQPYMPWPGKFYSFNLFEVI